MLPFGVVCLSPVCVHYHQQAGEHCRDVLKDCFLCSGDMFPTRRVGIVLETESII